VASKGYQDDRNLKVKLQRNCIHIKYYKIQETMFIIMIITHTV